jgi:hypothetical protein
VGSQPGRQGLCFAVGQHINGDVRLQIDQQRGERAATPQAEVIHAQHAWRGHWLLANLAH